MRGGRARLAAAATVIVFASAAARADPPVYCAKGGGSVDKERLAAAILDAAGVPRDLEARLDAAPAARASLTTREALIAYNTGLCGTLGCSPAETAQLSKALLSLRNALRDPEMTHSGSTDPERFFLDPASTLTCKPAAIASTATPARPTDGRSAAVVQGISGPRERWWERLRIRGASEDLIYRRTAPGFSDSAKAKIEFSQDNIKDKNTRKIVVDLGYAFEWDGPSSSNRFTSYAITPYAGVNIDTAKTKGVNNVSSDQREAGLILQTQLTMVGDGPITRAGITQYFALIPHYLSNHADKSKVAGIDFLYRPVLLLPLHVGINRFQEIRGTSLQYELIVDGRLNYGHFLDVGTRTGDQATDFLRIGGRFGVGFRSRIEALPLELTVTDTPMFALAGSPRRLNLFKTDLALYFTPKKYFGIDVAYANGRYRDLDEREDKWTIGLTVKY